jgi:tripartite ATP-independent transporter DctP family solute receptor
MIARVVAVARKPEREPRRSGEQLLETAMEQISMRRLARASALIVTAAGVALGASLEAREVKLGHLAPTADPRHGVLTGFAEAIADRTDGEITVAVFPDSTLGGEREMFEQAQAGVTELALVGAIASNFYPRWSIFDMPFLWESQEHVLAFARSELAKEWAADMAEQLGVEMLAFFDRNPRILTTRNRPVHSIDDLRGMKVRVPDIATFMDTWRGLGVEPVPMPAADFYMGLRLGTIDGMENPVEVMYHWKIYEVADYLSLTNHMRNGFFLIASKQFMDSLTEEQREIVREEAINAQQLFAERNREGADSLYDLLRQEGMVIIEDPDISGFVEAAREVHEKYMDRFGREAYEAALALGKN